MLASVHLLLLTSTLAAAGAVSWSRRQEALQRKHPSIRRNPPESVSITPILVLAGQRGGRGNREQRREIATPQHSSVFPSRSCGDLALCVSPPLKGCSDLSTGPTAHRYSDAIPKRGGAEESYFSSATCPRAGKQEAKMLFLRIDEYTVEGAHVGKAQEPVEQ